MDKIAELLAELRYHLEKHVCGYCAARLHELANEINGLIPAQEAKSIVCESCGHERCKACLNRKASAIAATEGITCCQCLAWATVGVWQSGTRNKLRDAETPQPGEITRS